MSLVSQGGETMSAVSWLSRLVKDGVIIAPSLLAANFAELGKEIHKLEEGGAQILHLDVMDGAYVPNISFGTPIISSIRKITPLKFDVHLMIEKPERYIERFCQLGADSLTVHVETVQDPAGVLDMIRGYGVAAGLALNYGTPVEQILPYAEIADLLLVMSVPAGFGGQAFRDDSLESVRRLRDYVGARTVIEIDGGIDSKTIALASQAGVDIFVAGTGVFRADDYGKQMDFLRDLATRV